MGLLRTVLLAFLSLTLVLLPGHSALAHDELTGTDPSDGETLDAAPESLTMTFSGQIAQVGAQVAVTGGPGGELVEGDPKVEGTSVVQDLVDLPSGDYEVLWRVTSQDGHPISGTFSFSVAAGPGAAEETSGEDAAETSPATSDETSAPSTDEKPDETPDGTDQASETSDSSGTGLPGWLWLTLGVVVLALLALVARTMLRNRR